MTSQVAEMNISRPLPTVDTALSDLRIESESGEKRATTMQSAAKESYSFFGEQGVTSGYSLEASFLPFESADSKADLRVLVTMKATGDYSDPFHILSHGHSSVLNDLPQQKVLGALSVEKEMSLLDFQTLRDRLIAIEEFSWEYEDTQTLQNVGRAFGQLFRAAALREDISELLSTTPLGDMSVRQY